MAYSDFKTLTKFKKEFDLHIQEKVNLFAQIESLKPSEFLTKTLAETVQLALAINTEKARFLTECSANRNDYYSVVIRNQKTGKLCS